MEKRRGKAGETRDQTGRQWFLSELEDLSDLAERLRHSFPTSTSYLRGWRRKYADLKAARPVSDLEAEKKLDVLATSLRRICLQMANLYTTKVYRSPPDHDAPRTTQEHLLDFGYERDIRPEELESRIGGELRPVDGWNADHLLFSSGQAALHSIVTALCHEFRHETPCTVRHLGSYFETDDLMTLFDGIGLIEFIEEANIVTAQADIVLHEPVQCTPHGQMKAVGDVEALASLCGKGSVKAVVCDTTLCGHHFDHQTFLTKIGEIDRPPIVIVFRSGLKLDQAGLELANVGIVSIFVSAKSIPNLLTAFSTELQHIRTLMGSGLGFEDINALSVPWFLDSSGHLYADAIFKNNADLARAYDPTSPLTLSHPVLRHPHLVAPFCTVQIPGGDGAAYEKLEDLIDREARVQGVLLQRGGSFGFRGHRYQAIVPETGTPFLRLALGARRDASSRKIGPLIETVARAHFSQ